MRSHIPQKHEVSLGNLYDINKQLMATMPEMTDAEIDLVTPQLEDWFNWALDGYAMLLCRERYDFTVFHLYEKQNPHPQKIAASELFEVLNERGKILSIEKTDENSWEIWIKIDKEAFAFYLFECDKWVIEC